SVSALLNAMPRDSFAMPPVRATGADGGALSLDAVVAKGERVTLAGPANRSAGGSAGAVQDGAPPAMAQLAVAAADAIGLQLAAVDIFDRGAEGLSIIEVNSNPMIATLEDAGRWDLIETIWRANIEAALR